MAAMMRERATPSLKTREMEMSRRMRAAATATFVQVTMGVAMGMAHTVSGRDSI
jgi:hypothetical protein